MKTLDERMDLITQRAQIIKDKRRRRKKAAALIAAPLSLCVLLCCIWLPADHGDGAKPVDGSAGGPFNSYEQVQIQSEGKTATVTDAAFVSELYGCITQVEELQKENAPLIIPDTGNKNTYTHIEICFSNASGSQVNYTLTGKMLTNNTTGAVNYLSSAQFLQLRTALREMAYEK